jgi:hypothetical protein
MSARRRSIRKNLWRVLGVTLALAIFLAHRGVGGMELYSLPPLICLCLLAAYSLPTEPEYRAYQEERRARAKRVSEIQRIRWSIIKKVDNGDGSVTLVLLSHAVDGTTIDITLSAEQVRDSQVMNRRYQKICLSEADLDDSETIVPNLQHGYRLS